MTVRVNVCVKEKAVCTGRACVLRSNCCLQAGNVCSLKGKEAPHLVNTAHNIICHESLIYTLFCLKEEVIRIVLLFLLKSRQYEIHRPDVQ